MGKNRIFFPQEALHAWLVEGRVDLTNDELTIKTEGRRYRLAEAARVVSEVTSTPDAFELVGKVKSLAFLRELGAELLDRSMLIGENAYDIVPGFLGAPVGSFAEHMAGSGAGDARRSRPDGMRPPSSDEELLGQFLLRVLLSGRVRRPCPALPSQNDASARAALPEKCPGLGRFRAGALALGPAPGENRRRDGFSSRMGRVLGGHGELSGRHGALFLADQPRAAATTHTTGPGSHRARGR